MRNSLFIVLSILFLPCYGQQIPAKKYPATVKADSFYNKYQQAQSTELKFKYLKKAIKHEPRDSFYMYLTNDYMLLGNYAKACKTAEKGMSTQMQSRVYDHILIDQYFVVVVATGNGLQWDKLLDSYKGDSVIFKNQFFKVVMKKRYVEDKEIVKDHFHEEIENWLKQPDSADYFSVVAHTYFQLGEKRKANQYFSKSKKYNKKDSWHLYYFGRILLMEGKFSKAHRNFVKAKAAGAGDAETYMRIIEKINECKGC